LAEPDATRVRKLLEQALELSLEERGAFLARECGEDQELRAAVERLLARAARVRPEFLEPPGSPQAPAERHVLGEFEIVRELGRGGMGVVYLARQLTLERQVAVKVFVESLTTTQREIDRFHREARAVAKLSHPGIVRVLTDGIAGKTHWFAMEYVDGHDLRREIRLQRNGANLAGESLLLPARGTPGHMAAVARICADVADALHHAHKAGLVHRDVNPANLLLARDGGVLIGDFGLVRDESLGALTRTGEVAGTPHYMSPEQARVRVAKVDHRTDVYSLGVVLYEMAALRRPFDGTTSHEIIFQIRSREPRPLRSVAPGVPRDLELICATAMAKDPNQRYSDAAALAADLRRFLNHDAIMARPPTLGERGRRWMRAHRVTVAAILLLGLGLLVGAAASAWWAHDRALGRLTVVSQEGGGSALRGSVRARRLDSSTGGVDAERVLGGIGIENVRLPPGWWRVEVEIEGIGVLAYERQVDANRETRIVVWSRTDLPDNRGMVRIEGGELSLRDANAKLSPINQRDILVEPFWLDACEVSNGEYRQFLQATGHAPPRHWQEVQPGVHDELPVVCVSWLDALAFAEWNGKRLPTFTEWNWAARGKEGRIYPWPDPVFGVLRGNANKSSESVGTVEDWPLYFRYALPVRSHPEACTPAGVFNLFGNVAEWTGSPFLEATAWGFEPRPAQRYVAGHAWDGGTKKLTLVQFSFYGIEGSYANPRTGFRCARSVRY
jgi:formylglycine-generating enzyme required for sulfatase activity